MLSVLPATVGFRSVRAFVKDTKWPTMASNCFINESLNFFFLHFIQNPLETSNFAMNTVPETSFPGAFKWSTIITRKTCSRKDAEMFSLQKPRGAEGSNSGTPGRGFHVQCYSFSLECSGLVEESSDEVHIFKLDTFIFCTQMECCWDSLRFWNI